MQQDSPKQPGGKKGSAGGVREIRYCPKCPDVHNNIHETNRVVTSKYNIVTFLPRFLFEMFSRVAYLYFLIQAALSWWSVVSPYSGIGATAALLFVLIVAGVKAVWEDKKRHKEDQIMNTSITHRLLPDGTLEDIPWTDVRVGDAIVVMDDENFPADLLCLRSDLPDNVCFIRTTNLDGETNLKIRKPLEIKEFGDGRIEDVVNLDLTLFAEAPNKNLHKFKGNAIIRGPDDEVNAKLAVTMNEMLLRGCTLKNSSRIVGLVVYTGRESRIQMNATKTPFKIGSFDRFLNFQITLVILMQLAMCLFCAVANYIWVQSSGKDHPYLALTFTVQGVYSNGFVQIIINFLTFWILLSYLVPISLFVTLEIVKFWQGFIFINLDKDMRDASGEHARCRNSNLNEDLGKVEYIFSDKTGTLTSNEMQLREVSIKGQVLGSASFRLEERRDLQGVAALKTFDSKLAMAARAVGKTPTLQSLVSSGGSTRKILAFHHSNPSHGTAGSLGLQQGDFSLDAFDPDSDIIDEEQQNLDTSAVIRSSLTLGHHMMDFFTNICLCHSLILEPHPDGGQPRYQGPSPDEVALVDAARQLGFEFVSRSQSGMKLNMLGHEVNYEILNVMEYSSERGCMSVIARSPDGTIRLYCKGADIKVMKKIRKDTDETLLGRTNADLHTFAKQGLRTLVLASKVIPEELYSTWDARYQEASQLLEERDKAMDELGYEIEKDLELIGVTAIEDKLQDGVPEAIKTLIDANIRVWMITGDKQETAVNIAVSCDLVRNVDGVIMLNVNEKSEDAIEEARDLLNKAADELCAKYKAMTGKMVKDIQEIPDTWREGELAVDGPTLTFILADKGMRLRLAQVAARCSGVVVSRSSPSQKAAIVKCMADYEMQCAAGKSRGFIKWYRKYRQRLRGKMLSIGDGANDVAMLQTADVGIGIMGKEGRQAVNNSDYAFSQFRFLVPLLLIHGNLSYYRLARLIKYSFYKNITFAFVMFYYQFYNGFSGQALVDSITAAVFNVVFTSLPIFLFAVLDRPVSELHAFIQYPKLYDKRNSRALTTSSFWKSGVLLGICHAAISFFVPYYSIATSGENNITDVYSLGKVTFVALLGIVTLEVALVARYWTWVFFWITLLSYFLVYPYMVIFPLAELGVSFYDPANVGVSYAVLSSPTFWLVILVCYIAAFGYRYAERTALWVFRPHDSMILVEREKAAEAQGHGLMENMSSGTFGRLKALGMVQSKSSLVRRRASANDMENGATVNVKNSVPVTSASLQQNSDDKEVDAAEANNADVRRSNSSVDPHDVGKSPWRKLSGYFADSLEEWNLLKPKAK